MAMELLCFLHDHEGTCHATLDLIVDDKVTLDQLKEQIHLGWKIDKRMQILFINGDEILGLKCTLLELGLKPLDKIIVKHRLLSCWEAFLSIVKLIKDHTDVKYKGLAMKAIKYRDELIMADFFYSYSNFISIEEDTRKVIAHFEDLEDSKLKDATTRFFNAMYENPENPQLEFQFRAKASKGMQGGLICDVKRAGEISTFFLKIHAARTDRSIGPVDMCELFVYRLLYFIKLGPEVFFIPNVRHPPFALYVATRAVDGFKKPKCSQVGNEQMTLLALVKRMFYLTDLHSDNFGLDKDNHLFIIDFQMDDIYVGSDEVWKNYTSEDKNERYRIGKEALKSFSIAKKIDDADSSLAETKNMLHQRDLNCHWGKYAEYLEKVKSNINLFEHNFAVPDL